MAYSFIAALFIKHAAVATGVAMRAKYKTDNFAASAALTYLDAASRCHYLRRIGWLVFLSEEKHGTSRH
jgi:hypothetical protein